MVTAEELYALADKVEQAAEPDAELHAEIARLVLGGRIKWHQSQVDGSEFPVRHFTVGNLSEYGRAAVANYMLSLDDAMTLVPEDAYWKVQNHPEFGLSAIITFSTGDAMAYGQLPAASLAAAALRCRAMMVDPYYQGELDPAAAIRELIAVCDEVIADTDEYLRRISPGERRGGIPCPHPEIYDRGECCGDCAYLTPAPDRLQGEDVGV
jgi:hypothetical protein